jgi:hypothetical protein
MLQQKIKSLLKVVRKLDRPPAGPNWVRFVHDDVDRTAKSILVFAKGQPQFNYQTGYRATKDRIELGISLETALRVVSEGGAPAGRIQNKEFVSAFFEYDERRKYSAANPIDFDTEFFRVSRDVLVPVAPLSIIREKGRFVPIFACGWTSNPLTPFQRRLLMTIYEDAFLSLTDYQNSPAEVLFFPKVNDGDERRRKPEVWCRGDLKLLTKQDLDQCLGVFVSAREVARRVLLEEIDALRKRAEEQEPAVPAQADGIVDLFTKK